MTFLCEIFENHDIIDPVDQEEIFLFDQVALTEWWAEAHGQDGIGFFSMHPGWVDTPGVSTSLSGFRERYCFDFDLDFDILVFS